jgi:two-component system sensor histidine kinase PilS (NtrC family)
MSQRRPGPVPVGALAGRLVAVGGIFALSVLLEILGRAPYSERVLTALYAVVLAGFLATLAQGILAAYGRGRSSVKLELVSDAVLITALVYCTGGVRSLFAFLYLAWIVYSALRLGTRGAAVTPLLAAVGYAVVTVGVTLGWVPPLDATDVATSGEAYSALGTHAVAFALVSLLAHRLTREIMRGRAQLHELGEIHRRIFDNVSTGILTVDPEGRISSFNNEAERITGHESREVVGQPIEQLLPGISQTVPLADRGSNSEAPDDPRGGLARMQFSFTDRAGESLHLGLSHSLLRDSGGSIDGSVLIFQDLTQVTKIQERLRRSERLAAVGQLAAGLAHEIRNPLASLSGAIELLARDLPDLDEGLLRLIRIVGRETARLNRLVSDFLGYARPGPPRREPIRLVELLGELIQLLRQGEHGDVTFELDAPAAATIEGDPDQVRQALLNLMLNAAEAGGARVVRVHLESAADNDAGVAISVEDRGVGIPPDQLDRMFEPFFTTKPKGTGLGLATVHRIIESHGGAIEVSSEVKRGTLVRVWLPGIPAP